MIGAEQRGGMLVSPETDASSATLEHITRGFVTAPARLLLVVSCDDRACAMQLVRNQRSDDGADRWQGQGSC